MSDREPFAANPIAQQERAWWDAHTEPECVWGADGDGVAACYRQLAGGLGDLPDAGLAVDLGCGPGRLLVPFARRHPRLDVVGVDVSRRMLDLVPADRPANVRLELGDGRTVPVFDETACAVWSVLVFQHVPPAAQLAYVREIGRVLELGGRAVVQVVLGDEADGSFLDQRTDERRLARAAWAAGLELVEHDRGAVMESWSWFSWRKVR